MKLEAFFIIKTGRTMQQNNITKINEEEINLFLNYLSDKASEISLKYFRSNFTINNKSTDIFNPVTNVDIEIEKLLRSEIKKKYPDFGILGEEIKSTSDLSDVHFVIDPIDGTKAFIAGVPVWTTLIALNNGKIPIMGIADQPYICERYIGSPKGSFLIRNGNVRKITSKDNKDLKDAVLSCTDPTMFENDDLDVFLKLQRKVSYSRYGLDALSYCLLASGHIDLIVETDIEPYDIQALIPLIKASNGYISTWNNDDPSNGGKIIAACS